LLKLRASLFALVALLCTVPVWRAAAQQGAEYEREPQGLERDFLLRVWETADGLLPTNVRSIAQTRDGYVWLAAFDGYVRLDGVRATIFSGKNTPGLPAIPKATRVFADARNRLWAATSEGRIFSLEDGNWREHREVEGWPRLVVESIAESGERLIFTSASSAMQWVGDRFRRLAPPALPRDFKPPLKALFDRAGRLWLTSPSHAWREEGGGWKLVLAATNHATTIQGAAAARDGGVWIASPHELRKYVDDVPVVTHGRPEDFRNDQVEMLEDFHGHLWVGGSNSGLRVWMNDGRVLASGTNTERLRAQITCLVEDRERNVLVGTAGAGVARFKPRPFSVWFGRLGGLSGTIVNTVGEEPSGTMLIGTEGSGLRRVGPGIDSQPIVSRDGLLGPRHRVTSIIRLRDGTMLAAVSGRGIFRVEQAEAVAIPAEPIATEHVRVLFEDSKGRVWAGHEKGLAVRRGERFEDLPAPARFSLTGVRAAAEDREGRLWFIGKEGLARLTGDRLEMVRGIGLPEKANLLGLYADAEGALWVGVESRGAFRLKEGRGFLYTTGHGLPVVSPGAFLEEGEYLWLSGEKGLVRINRASLEAVAAGRAARLELQLFNRADGLPSDACRRGYQPVAWRAQDGELWFATHKGAVAVQPKTILAAAYEPPAIIEEIRAETQLILVTPANRERIEIPAGTRHTSIRCSIPSLGRPEYARFQYQLEGADNLWHDAGGERVIRFYDLHPGSYRFHVRAFGTDGRLADVPTSVGLVVLPFYWETLWFRVLIAVGLAAVVALSVWWLLRQRFLQQEERLHAQEARAQLESQLQQAQKMEAIGRLAGGIAHDFNNLLTSIAGNAELLQMELPARDATRGTAADIATAAGRARDLVSQILTFSRQKPVEKRPLDFAPLVREALQLLRSGIPAMIELRAEIPETLPPILADAAQIQRVVMNLGTNAAQAVGSGRGHISIRVEESSDGLPVSAPPGRYLRLSVEDDGRGMDDETLRRIFDPFFTTKEIGHGTGLGLSVVHGLVEAHDGFITVRSRPGAGTTFHVFLPVTSESIALPVPDAALVSFGAGERILVIDDEAVVLKVTRMMLERLGYVVDGYTDASAALAAFSAAPQSYRLAITDFAMPQHDGVALAQRLWEVRPAFPIILYSGYGSRLTPEEAVRMGFAELLPKPFQLSALAEAVKRALAAKRADSR
jgi:signal transduction histidine kinase/ligand-binding sensor domain-containing protein/ActR/RegA family two-component response regulator